MDLKDEQKAIAQARGGQVELETLRMKHLESQGPDGDKTLKKMQQYRQITRQARADEEGTRQEMAQHYDWDPEDRGELPVEDLPDA